MAELRIVSMKMISVLIFEGMNKYVGIRIRDGKTGKKRQVASSVLARDPLTNSVVQSCIGNSIKLQKKLVNKLREQILSFQKENT